MKDKRSFNLLEQGRILKYLFSFAVNQAGRFSLSVILMILVSMIAAYLPIIIQKYLDEYLAQGSATTTIALQTAITYLILELLRAILTYLKDYLFNTASEETVAQMRNRLFKKLGILNMNYYHRTPNGELVSRITNDTETIKEFWNVFLTFFDGLINAITIAVAMFSLNSNLSWIFMAFVPIVIVLIIVYQKVSTRVYSTMRKALAKVNTRLSESITGIQLIQHFNQDQRMEAEFEQIDGEYVEARINMFKMNALLLNPAVNLIQQVVLALLIWLFGYAILKGQLIEIGLIYAFTSYARSFFAPIASMIDSMSVYQNGLVSASRGISLLDNQELEPNQNNQSSAEITGNIELNQVSFAYQEGEDVLRDINIAAQSGQMIALVGHTGSGKSTVINLMMRFFEFHRGTIYIDGRDIRDYSHEELRKSIGLVHQDSFIFHGNFLDNIRLHGNYSDEEVMEAARFAGADHFIEKTKNGYYTMISEGGTSLSAGQKQLISIARTVLRQPQILIFDEATANVDTETEQYIQASLEKIRQKHTLIVIAHRLSTIRNADKIYVLNHGRIVEEGQHNELIDQEGTYYQMYRLQTLQGLTD